jgi:hypothetical protein
MFGLLATIALLTPKGAAFNPYSSTDEGWSALHDEGWYTTKYSTTYDFTDCGGVIHGSSGQITSPYYPGHYPNYADCWWDVILEDNDDNAKVILTFDHFDLEENYDFLRIYVGDTEYTYTGIHTDLTVEIVGSSFSIKFTSDFSITESGFSLSFELVDPCPNCEPFETLKYDTYDDSEWKLKIVKDTSQDVSKALKKSGGKVEVGGRHPYVIERADGSPFCVKQIDFEVACMDKVRVRILLSGSNTDQPFSNLTDGWEDITAVYDPPVQADKVKLTFWESDTDNCSPGYKLRHLSMDYCV